MLTAAAATERDEPPPQLYLPDRQAMGRAQVAGLATVPAGAESVCITALPVQWRLSSSSSDGSEKPSFLLLFSERPR